MDLGIVHLMSQVEKCVRLRHHAGHAVAIVSGRLVVPDHRGAREPPRAVAAYSEACPDLLPRPTSYRDWRATFAAPK